MILNIYYHFESVVFFEKACPGRLGQVFLCSGGTDGIILIGSDTRAGAGTHQSSGTTPTGNQGCQQSLYQEQVRHSQQHHGLVP